MHLQRGAYGATRGRTYKKDKMSSLDEATFGTAKLLFDDTDLGWTSTSDTGATYFCGARRYRMPEVLGEIARSDEVSTSTERHGVPLDPHEPLSLDPQAPFGYDYDDPANLAFWWSQGALTAWQLVPGTLAAANRWRLWDTDLFSRVRRHPQLCVEAGPAVAQLAARELAPMAAFGVLAEAHTYTWRSPEVMLSSVVDHRFGDNRDQAHAWQATIDPDALVFTTHPAAPDAASRSTGATTTDYWTGSASMPRSAQHHNVAIHVYSPRYDAADRPAARPGVRLPAARPTPTSPRTTSTRSSRRDGWTFGRKGDGYVALWSMRPTTWRSYDPTVVATRGLTQPFDLVAEGGARNVWIVEVARRADAGDFAAFVDAVAAAPIEAELTGGTHRVRYRSPSQGELELSTGGGLRVDGDPRRLADHDRLESPWGDVCYLGTVPGARRRRPLAGGRLRHRRPRDHLTRRARDATEARPVGRASVSQCVRRVALGPISR